MHKKLFAISLLLLLSCSDDRTVVQPQEEEVNWTLVRASDQATLPSEFEAATLIGLSTDGWEDHVRIDRQGDFLYFSYCDRDLNHTGSDLVEGPLRDADSLCTPLCGEFPRSDLFVSSAVGSGWGTPVPHPLSIENSVSAPAILEGQEAWFHRQLVPQALTDLVVSYYTGDTWTTPERQQLLSSAYRDEYPTLDDAAASILFASNRPGGAGGMDLYYAQYLDGNWTEPEALPENVNSSADETQPWLHGATVYYVSNRNGRQQIFRTIRDNAGNWSEPELIVSARGDVRSPSISNGNRYLYFVQVFSTGDGSISTADIMCAERR